MPSFPVSPACLSLCKIGKDFASSFSNSSSPRKQGEFAFLDVANEGRNQELGSIVTRVLLFVIFLPPKRLSSLPL